MTARARNVVRRLPLALLIACLVLSPVILAADNPAGKAQNKPAVPQAPKSEEEMMAAYAKYANPGPEHEILKGMAGNWKTVTKAWMGPGEPKVSEGRSKTSVILDGRFITDEYKGTFMDKPFEGFGITGYDLYKKEYVSVWTDNMGTTIMMSRGKMDPSGKVLTLYGTFDDPVSGQKQTLKEVTRIVDNNTHVFEMYSNHDGKEAKEMEITYTRE